MGWVGSCGVVDDMELVMQVKQVTTVQTTVWYDEKEEREEREVGAYKYATGDEECAGLVACMSYNKFVNITCKHLVRPVPPNQALRAHRFVVLAQRVAVGCGYALGSNRCVSPWGTGGTPTSDSSYCLCLP